MNLKDLAPKDPYDDEIFQDPEDPLIEQEPQQVPNPTNFMRLYYGISPTQPQAYLYRNTHNLDPKNHYEFVDNLDSWSELRNAGQYPLLIDQNVNLEGMNLSDLWPYVEKIRQQQYERAPELTRKLQIKYPEMFQSLDGQIQSR